MTENADFFGEFPPHSQHKLLILEKYFEAWGFKLALRPGAGDELLYVDACAGPGRDDTGNPGSPLIAARAAAVAQAHISKRRGAPFRIRVVAIEKNKKHFAALSDLLAPFGSGVTAKHGSLDQFIDEIETEFKALPWLYFIDPFGLEPLRATLVRRALDGPMHEVFLLFAGQAALRHFGAVDEGETRAERKRDRFNDRVGSQIALFDEMNQQVQSKRESLAQRARESRVSRNLTRDSAVRILNAAYDDEGAWLQQIDETHRERRREVFLERYLGRLASWGAEYRLPIPILNSDGTQVYTLIHATHSAVGHRTMKEAVHYALRHSPLPSTVTEHMRQKMRANLQLVAASIRHRFAGKNARWAEDKLDRSTPSVRNYALEQTPMHLCDADELKRLLKPFRVSGATIVYRFPDTSS